jgi:hypothetical protein
MAALELTLAASPEKDGKPSLKSRDAPAAEADHFFESKVRPILANACLKCHGGMKSRGNLRLDSRAALLRGGEHGPAVVPGDPDKSLLIQAVRYTHEKIKMPPGKPLSDAAVSDLVAWVHDGASWPQGTRATERNTRWAFEPIRVVEPPADPSGWANGSLDRFIRAKQRQQNLQPAAPADKYTLLRRVTYDLTGLPPAPQEIEDFVKDDSAGAYEKVVDRLLASPRYGERWGRHWLDVVRYGDTGGFESDHLYPSAWRYRDYIIRSLNSDKSIDRFLQEQVAGDELWPDDPDAVVATGLYCVGPALEESAMVTNQLEYEWLTDAADTTGAAFLGLTLGCARCHDHKFDPITQKDYYSMQAVFGASDRPYPDKVRLLRIKSLNGLLSESPVPEKLKHDERCTIRTEDEEGFRLFHRSTPLEVHLLKRGELSKPAEVMAPAVPVVIRSADHKADFSDILPAKSRAALAKWLTAPDNPLTARVFVNRVWGWHFGQALVRTPNDFGAQGEAPTHPELLDWLARDFMDHGWDLKRLHRLILLSNTYKMESVANEPDYRADPENRLLAHFSRRRLEGEALRDGVLSCAGTLNLKQFGPAVVPPLGQQELTGLFDSKGKWPATKDPAEYTRRSVYLLVRRTFTYPMFAAFDPPETMSSCPRRLETIVPTQALTLLNSPLMREQSAAFARRLLKNCGDNPEKIAARAWLLAFGRPIRAKETEQVVRFLKERTAALTDAKGPAAPSAHETALMELCLTLFNANEFVDID